MCSVKEMARGLEGGRESLKLRDVSAPEQLPGTSSSSAPSTRLLSLTQAAPFLQREGNRSYGSLLEGECCSHLLCHVWSSS